MRRALALLLASCSLLLLQLRPAPAAAAGYTPAEAVQVATQLAKKKEMPAEKRTQLLASLQKALSSEARGRPIQGVLVFRSGEGGFIVKFMKGDGLVSFKGGKQAGPLSISSWSAGALVGGSATWGVGLVLGLQDVSHFGGEYGGEVKTATAGDATTPNGLWLQPADDEEGKKAHDLLLILSARGLSAGIGRAKMTIAPDW